MNDINYLSSWICTALMRLGTRMATEFDQQFARSGITQAQFRILLAIWELGGSGGIAPSRLADHLLLERGTVSVLTNRMVERGWISRQPGQNRRTYQLTLTEAGTQVLQEVVPRAVGLANHTLSGISLDELLQMQASLQRVETRLREYTPPLESEGL
jgi:DNA-binding MarR family transcriptional regulator